MTMNENRKRRSPRATGRPGKRTRETDAPDRSAHNGGNASASRDDEGRGAAGPRPARNRPHRDEKAHQASRPRKRGRRRGGPDAGPTHARGANGTPGESRLPELPRREPADASAFASLGLNEALVAAIGRIGYASPTPIQKKAIPLALESRDVLGLAQTGTGKTAAFGLPLVQSLAADPERVSARSVRALVLAPTRELAAQIAANLKAFSAEAKLRVVMVVGGLSIAAQEKALARGTDILVATPGRLLDLVERRAVGLGEVSRLVLDEADQMLDLGFLRDLKKIARMLGTPRHTMLFSATMPQSIAELAREFTTDAVRVETAPPGKPADRVEQGVHYLDNAERPDALIARLQNDAHADAHASALVFCRTKHGAERLMKRIVAAGLQAASIHGNKSQNQRDRAIAQFKSGSVRVLVATDVAARGIDVPGVSHVYNYELPEVPEAYVHRIGRTARAGADGTALAFCTPEEFALLLQIERLLGRRIETVAGERPERAIGNGKAKRGARGRPPRANGTPGQRAPRGEGAKKLPASDGQPRRPKAKRPRRPRRAA